MEQKLFIYSSLNIKFENKLFVKRKFYLILLKAF